MKEIKQKLEETLNRLYKKNQISIDAFSELIEFAAPDKALQLIQTDVSKSVCGNCERKQLYIKKQCYCGYCGDRLKT
jgi:hypothetical protein